MNKRSDLTFEELSESLSWTKIYWNGEIIYNDELDLPFKSIAQLYQLFGISYVDTHFGKSGIEYVLEKYGPKKVYSMYVNVVHSHHCILYIEGEE